MKILLVIPAFNEEDNIIPLINCISLYKKYDYVIINDASTDSTYEVCKLHNLNVVCLPVNLGIGGAVQTGFMYAMKYGYDIVVQVDGDGQHDVAFVEKLLQPIYTEDSDVVIGSRFISNEGFQSSFMRRLGIKFLNTVIYMATKQRFTDCTSGFRAYNKSTIKLLSTNYPQDYPEPESLVYLERLGFRITEVPVVMKERAHGKSSIHSFKSVYYMIKVTMAVFIDCLKYSRSKGK